MLFNETSPAIVILPFALKSDTVVFPLTVNVSLSVDAPATASVSLSAVAPATVNVSLSVDAPAT